jgi:hypothetical protein
LIEVVEFESSEGAVLVEVERQDVSSLRRVSKDGGKTVAKATESFDQAIDSVLPAAGRLLDSLQGLKPDSAQLEFGVKLSGELGGILAKASGEGHITVTLTWQSVGSGAESGS